MLNREALKEKSPDLPGKAGLINCYYGVSKGPEATMRNEKKKGFRGMLGKEVENCQGKLGLHPILPVGQLSSGQ